MELYRILPKRILVALDKLDKGKLCELRLRPGGVSVNYGGSFFGLSENGLSKVGMKMTSEEIESAVLKASGYSIYAVNDQIKNGYLALEGGVRMGICGEVSDKTIKRFSSLNIRFPHEVKGCSDKIIGVIARAKGCYNTLIVSPPGCGKTTLLRDLIRSLSNRGNNVLVADERYELSGGGVADLGVNTDVISGTDKNFAFSRGIRYMRPDILCADEIMTGDDVKAIELACMGGVNVIASMHGDKCTMRFDISCMERTVVLSDGGGPGRIDGVYDNKGNRLL